ncbi:MAG: CYTH domain-containing protein, partial [Halobacteria archaeon]|nr:CYTH domain-containing protein [Halobacteria archaeon]
VLESLGFVEFETVVKHRTVYEIGGGDGDHVYEILLDDVEGVGEFVEVETEASEENYDEARDGVIEIIEELGLDPDESITTSYLGLLIEQKQ